MFFAFAPSTSCVMYFCSILAKFNDMLSDGRSPPDDIDQPDTPVSHRVMCRYSELSWSARVNANSTCVFRSPSSELRHNGGLAGSECFEMVISETDACDPWRLAPLPAAEPMPQPVPNWKDSHMIHP